MGLDLNRPVDLFVDAEAPDSEPEVAPVSKPRAVGNMTEYEREAFLMSCDVTFMYDEARKQKADIEGRIDWKLRMHSSGQWTVAHQSEYEEFQKQQPVVLAAWKAEYGATHGPKWVEKCLREVWSSQVGCQASPELQRLAREVIGIEIAA